MMYSGMLSPQFILAETATAEQSNRMAELAAEAKANWLQEGHPGWSVTQADSQDFIARLQQVQVCRNHVKDWQRQHPVSRGCSLFLSIFAVSN